MTWFVDLCCSRVMNFDSLMVHLLKIVRLASLQFGHRITRMVMKLFKKI